MPNHALQHENDDARCRSVGILAGCQAQGLRQPRTRRVTYVGMKNGSALSQIGKAHGVKRLGLTTVHTCAFLLATTTSPRCNEVSNSCIIVVGLRPATQSSRITSNALQEWRYIVVPTASLVPLGRQETIPSTLCYSITKRAKILEPVVLGSDFKPDLSCALLPPPLFHVLDRHPYSIPSCHGYPHGTTAINISLPRRAVTMRHFLPTLLFIDRV